MVTGEERGRWKGKISEEDYEVQTNRFKINKTEGCNVKNKECNKYFIITLNEV